MDKYLRGTSWKKFPSNCLRRLKTFLEKGTFEKLFEKRFAFGDLKPFWKKVLRIPKTFEKEVFGLNCYFATTPRAYLRLAGPTSRSPRSVSISPRNVFS